MVALTSFVLQELRLALGSTMKAHGVGFLASEQAALPQEVRWVWLRCGKEALLL